jgi:hypothetical protein
MDTDLGAETRVHDVYMRFSLLVITTKLNLGNRQVSRRELALPKL